VKLAFLGSPEFAVHSLRALVDAGFEIATVITQPDRPAGRGLAAKAPAVKEFTQKHRLSCFQPETVNAESTLQHLRDKSVDQIVVVAYGEFLGASILKFGKFPPINVHPSLLPDLRGAAPVQWALLRGYRQSGVSTQFMVKKMDAGDVLLQERAEIGENENAQDLLLRLGIVGGRLLVKTLQELQAGSISPTPQDESKATFAPLLEKSQGEIRWASSAWEIHNQVRGLFPWPSAVTSFLGQRVKILKSQIPLPQASPQKKLALGEFVAFGPSLFVGTGDGLLEVLSIQPEGKRALLPDEFANGIRGKHPDLTTFKFGE
jgi:methionyl-tRNA formyltransferase